MHTEHLENVRPSWVAFGWFISFAVTALTLFVLIFLGVLGTHETAGEGWVALSFVVGFAVGGFFATARTRAAPILHGIGIGLFSLVVWFAVNLFLGEPTEETAWRDLSPGFGAGLLILQIAAAVAGGWAARKLFAPSR